ncbi:MAG: efflux RND transporter periplasmic adaptor subunit [Gemmatimonadota bacterium]
MKTRTRNGLIISGILLGAVAVAAVLILRRPEPPRTPPPARIPTVTTAEIRPGSGPLPVTGAGTVRPRAEVALSPQVSGQVAWVSPSLVSGGRVRAGQALLRIDPADFENAVEQARAQVAQDSVGLLQAQEEARIALAEYRQFQDRQGVNGDPSPLALREPQLQAARAALQRSQAQLADARLALDRSTVRAPFDATVRSESVDPGSYATAGQSLAVLYSNDAVEVIVPLTDGDAALIAGLWELETGSEARRIPARVISEYGAHRYAWEGYVDRVETALDEESRTIDVVVRVPDPLRRGVRIGSSQASAEAPPLLVGQYVEVRIDGREGDFLVVPRRAIRPGDEVWVVADSAVRIVPVDVLQQSGDSAFVAGSFRPAERAVVSGVELATDGMRVRPDRPGGGT